MKRKLLKDHTHAGQPYKKGESIEVKAGSAAEAFMVAHGVIADPDAKAKDADKATDKAD